MMNVENDGLISGKKAKKKINDIIQASSVVYISGLTNIFTNSTGYDSSSCNKTSTGTTPASGTTDANGNLYYVASDSSTFDKALPITFNSDTTKSTILTGTLSSSKTQDIFYYNASSVSNAQSYYIYLNAQNNFGLEYQKPNPAPAGCLLVDEASPESSSNTTGYFRNSTTVQVVSFSSGQYNSYSTALQLPTPTSNNFIELQGSSGITSFAAYFVINQPLSQIIGSVSDYSNSYGSVFSVISSSLLSNASLFDYSPGQRYFTDLASTSSGYFYTVSYNSTGFSEYCWGIGNVGTSQISPFCVYNPDTPGANTLKNYVDAGRERGLLLNTNKPVYIYDSVNDVAPNYKYLNPIQLKGHTYIRCNIGDYYGNYSGSSVPYYVQISTQKPEKVMYYSEDYNPVFVQNYVNAMSGSGGISTGNSALDSVLSPMILNATSGIDDHKVYKKSSLDSCIANLKAKIPATYEANLALLSNTLKCGTSSAQINPTMVAGLNCKLQESGIFQLTKDIGF